MTFRRRQYMTEPGEALILPHRSLDIVTRYATFVEDTGLSGDDVCSLPLVAIPVPVHRTARLSSGRAWPSRVSAAMMWHPLMWLPERVSQRYRIATPDGGVLIETEEEWMVRVALEMMASGLYDTESGTWVDVLDTVGMDIDDPIDLARVEEWLEGMPDEDMDRIDLSPGLDNADDPEWAFKAAAELMPSMVPASWAILADDLSGMIFDIVQDAEEAGAGSRQAVLVASIALGVLADAPQSEDSGEAPQFVWRRLMDEFERFQGDISDLIDGPLTALSDSLYEIRDEYWPYLAALGAQSGDVMEDVTP